MQKSASAYKTISEVSEMLDIPAHVLRFWESKFSQLKPMKRSGGRRYYRLEDIALLETIKSLLYDEGYTIKGAQASLSKRRKVDAVPASPEAAGQGSAVPSPSVAVSLPSLQQAASLLAQAQSRIDTLLARI
ncbi:MAG: MerR family transcriptional regulator [Pseudomonadota bacterium]|nr:MerR family transcriptional regulator [Pseudomonadota bacterium]